MAPIVAPCSSLAWKGTLSSHAKSTNPFVICTPLRRPFCSTTFSFRGLGRPVCSRVLAAPSMVNIESVPEEVVEGVVNAVLEPNAVDRNQFQAHDTAQQMVLDLQDLVATMQREIDQVEELNNDSEWDGPYIKTSTKQHMLKVYRSERKQDERQRQADRRLKRVMRTAGASLQPAVDSLQPAVESLEADNGMSIADQEELAKFEQLQRQSRQSVQPQSPVQEDTKQQRVSALAERRSERQKRRQERLPASPAVEQAQPQLQQEQPPAQAVQQQQPMQAKKQPQLQQLLQQRAEQRRLRRRRSSTSAATAAAPTVLQDSTSSSGSVHSTQPQPAELVTPSIESPSVAEVQAMQQQHPLLPTTAAADPQPAAVSSTISSSSSSVTASLPARQGFVPLALQRTPAPRSDAVGAAARSSRRVVRGGAAARPAPAAAAASPANGSSAVSAALMAGAKLSDNNINGLDMRADLLSPDQEKELAVMVQDLLHLERVCRELHISLGRRPSDLEWMAAAGCPAEGDTEEMHAAVQQFRARLQHGRSAKQVMISANYKLVVSICRKYQGYGMALGDLINEGIAGLVKGVERFEPNKGCKFGTYAHWWIRQSVTRSLSEQGRLVRVPSHMQELLTKMARISRNFEAQYGREPTLQDFARELGVEPAKIADAYDAVYTPRSLDQPMNDGEGATLGDVLEDERMLDAEDTAHIEGLKQDMEAVLANLPPREAGVLRMRFGLVDGVERTLDEIGAQYDVTRERIRQIEAKAIRQLRARQTHPGSVIADYQEGGMESKQLASRTSSGTKKQS